MSYSALKYKIAKIWKMRKVKVIPVVKRALGTVTKHFEKQIQKLDLNLTIEASQFCLLGTASGYDMKKKEATIPKPKKIGWCSLLWHFLPINKVGHESRRNNNKN